MKMIFILAAISFFVLFVPGVLANPPGMMTWGSVNSPNTTSIFGTTGFTQPIMKLNITLPLIANTTSPSLYFYNIETDEVVRGIPLYVAFDFLYLNDFYQMTVNRSNACEVTTNGRVFMYSGDGELYYCDDGIMERLSS